MFKKFFQRKPVISDQKRQLELIETLHCNSPPQLGQLLELAKSNTDTSVRCAAVSRIEQRDCLAVLLKNEQNTAVRSQLMTQLFKLCSDDEALAVATDILQEADSDSARSALLAETQHPAAAVFIISRIQDPQLLLRTAVEHKVSRVRLAAAQQLQNEKQLLELSHNSRDKSVSQWVRARLKETKKQRQQQEQKQALVQKLLEDSRQLSTSENPVDYRLRLDRLQTRRDELQQQASTEQLAALKTLLSLCSTRADTTEAAEQQPPLAAPEEPVIETAAAEEPTAIEDPNASIRKQIHAHLAEALEASKAPSSTALQSLLDTSHAAWDKLSNDRPEHPYHHSYARLLEARNSLEYLAAHNDALIERCATPIDNNLDDSALHTLRSDLSDHLKALDWPVDWEVPTTLQTLRTTQQKAQELHRQRRDQSRKRAQQLDKKIHRMGDALRRKNLRLANSIHREVEETLPKLPASDQHRLQKNLDKHLPELAKLLDWHEYSSQPKKEELCAQVEALIVREQAPEARAESVKQLRKEWRTVTAANVKKDDPLWVRFNDAAEKAYAPCLPFFEKLKQRKGENLKQRERLTTELEQLLADINWEEPPFDMLTTVLRVARTEWQQYSPIHFPEAKPCQKRFDAAMDRIHGALQQQRKDNAALREQLIARATALAALDDNSSAISQALKLQDEWKAVGPVSPQMQRRQWQQFRAPMDAVFAQRQAVRDADHAEQKEQNDQVSALLDKLEAIADLPEEQLPHAIEESQQLQQQIDEACHALPKNRQSGFIRRQSALLSTIENKQRSLPLHRRAKSYAALAALGHNCHLAETALLNGEDMPSTGIDLNDSPWKSLMQTRAEHLEKNNAELLRTELEDNLETLENLAIELEILAEVDTPDAYRGQRRVWQLDMLESGNSFNDGSTPEELFFDILQRWYATGAVEKSVYEPLQQRLQRASQPFSALLISTSP